MKKIKPLILLLMSLSISNNIFAKVDVKFDIFPLLNEQLQSPTSLQFGPDGRLYISQQNGLIWAFNVERSTGKNGKSKYQVSSSEKIDPITLARNHNDLGQLTDVKQRLVTGLVVSGTKQNPVIYVSSSNPQMGGGKSARSFKGDTNSGLISQLRLNGDEWIHTDLVRGLPRNEENHGPNGMAIYQENGRNLLLLAQGGLTNKGVPSNNFVGLSEYYMSDAILRIDLTQLDSMIVNTDPRTGGRFVYDLPTLDDPTRPNITNQRPDNCFPTSKPISLIEKRL